MVGSRSLSALNSGYSGYYGFQSQPVQSGGFVQHLEQQVFTRKRRSDQTNSAVSPAPVVISPDGLKLLDEVFGLRSLTGALIMALAQLWGDRIVGTPDEFADLLDKANQIHGDAQKPGATEEQKDLSALLYLSAAKIWARNNHDEASYPNDEALVDAYKQHQGIELTSTQEANFKTRDQMASDWAKAYADGLRKDPSRPGNVFVLGTPPWSSGESSVSWQAAYDRKKQSLLDGGAAGGLDKAYYQQFFDYLNANKKLFSQLDAWNAAVGSKETALRPSEYNLPVIKAWEIMIPEDFFGIDTVSGQWKPVPFVPSNIYAHAKKSIIFQAEDGTFGLINEDGTINKIKSRVMDRNGNPDGPAIIKEITGKNVPYGVGKVGLHSLPGKTVKDLAEEMAEKRLTAAVVGFKDANYNKTGFQQFLSILPFYDAITNAINDPLSKPDALSIVFDVADIVVTIASAGFATIGKAGIVSIKAATKGLSGAAKTGKILSMAAKKLLSQKGATKLTREIADFAVPIFTARDIVIGSGRLLGKGSGYIKNLVENVGRNMDQFSVSGRVPTVPHNVEPPRNVANRSGLPVTPTHMPPMTRADADLKAFTDQYVIDDPLITKRVSGRNPNLIDGRHYINSEDYVLEVKQIKNEWRVVGRDGSVTNMRYDEKSGQLYLCS